MSDIAFIFGQRGTGKTTLAKQILSKSSRAIIFDPLLEYKASLIARTDDILKLAGLLQSSNKSRFHLAYSPSDLKQVRGREYREFSFFCRIARAVPRCLVLFDEIHSVVNVHTTSADFNNLLRFSRHNSQTIVCVSHRPADVPRIVTYLATKLYCFRMHEPGDIMYLRKILGSATDRLQTLPDFHYLKYATGNISEGIVKK